MKKGQRIKSKVQHIFYADKKVEKPNRNAAFVREEPYSYYNASNFGLRPYTDLVDTHINESAFILGSGTSLHDLDLSHIHNHVVITLNASILLVDWVKGDPNKRFWISNDAFCRKWSYWADIKKAKANKIVRNSWSHYFKELRGFYVFCPRRTRETKIDTEDTGLCYCSSVPSAVDLALQMGCKKVFLLGVDQYMKGSKRYFWEYWERQKRPKFNGKMHAQSKQMRVFKINDGIYKSLNDFSVYKDAFIFNCNPKSKVSAFTKIPFHQSLSIANS